MQHSTFKASFRGKLLTPFKRNGSVYINLSYPLECTPTSCDPYSVDLSPGTYEIGLWGASGGTNTKDGGGRGAYVSAQIKIRRSLSFLAFVGSKGVNGTAPTFGGGGPCLWSTGYTGGGATDLRLNESLESRILVAGAGAGDAYYIDRRVPGGDAGADLGFSGSCDGSNPSYDLKVAQGGAQRYYDNRGIGFDSEEMAASNGVLGMGGRSGVGYDLPGSGGGGGYYGGGGGAVINYNVGSGAGGSSYVGKSQNIFQIIKYEIISGREHMPGIESIEDTGNLGNGFITISKIKNFSMNKKVRIKSVLLLADIFLQIKM